MHLKGSQTLAGGRQLESRIDRRRAVTGRGLGRDSLDTFHGRRADEQQIAWGKGRSKYRVRVRYFGFVPGEITGSFAHEGSHDQGEIEGGAGDKNEHEDEQGPLEQVE